MKLSPFIISYLVSTAVASPGDRLEEFGDCANACEYQRKCPQSDLASMDHLVNEFTDISFERTPIFLELMLFWDCVADCDYQCQQIITRDRILKDQEIYQFHGKWPFLRLLGTQELFSVLFSLGNFLPHYFGYMKLLHRLKALPHRGKRGINPGRLLKGYMMVAVAGMFAWSASSIFHLRDLLITEKLDYFFAGGTVLSGFHAIFSRITRLDRHPFLAKVFTCTVSLIFALHILRLYIDWSYTYNMRFNVFFGILQYILLLVLAFRNYIAMQKNQKGKPRVGMAYNKLITQVCIIPVVLVVTTASGMLFELFDFFNYSWQVDSHALWHLCTIWPSWALYDFFLADFNFTVKEASD